MAIAVLIDTNVFLDDLLLREPHCEASHRLMEACRRGDLEGYVAAHAFPDMFYIMRKAYPPKIRRNLLKSVCDMFHVVGTDEAKVRAAIDDTDFSDFEDCLVEKCALSANVGYIVTWNVRDYSASRVPVITPAELLARLEEQQ